MSRKRNGKQLEKMSAGVKTLMFAQVVEFQSEIGYTILLNQFLKTGYGLEVYQAKVLFHLVNGLNCLASVFGAVVSDSFLNSYTTILYAFIPYMIGLFLMILFSVNELLAPYGKLPFWSYLVSCLFIAVGLGGIRPCFFALSGDQFLPSQKKEMDRMFSANFILVCVGSLPVIYIIPTLKDKIKCFGAECYPLSYVFTLTMVVIGYIAFISGKSMFRIVPTQGNFIPGKIFNILCIQPIEYRTEIDMKFLNEVKQLGKVFSVALCLSFYFLLNEQTMSEWMNQYDLMDKHIFGIPVPTEASPIISPLASILIAPALTLLFFPFIESRGFFISPQYRIVIGYIVIILAFVTSTILESFVQFYSGNAVKLQGVIVDCPGCVSGSWQIIQFCLSSLSSTLIYPNVGLFLYQNVNSQFKCTSASFLFVSVFLANLMIIILEIPLQSLSSPILRQSIYIFISSLGLALCFYLIKTYFPEHPEPNETYIYLGNEDDDMY